jgi:hypothetical protein
MTILDNAKNIIKRLVSSSEGVQQLEKLEGDEKWQYLLARMERQADEGSEMHIFMLKRYYENKKNGMSNEEAVRVARNAGIVHNAWQDVREAKKQRDQAIAKKDSVSRKNAEQRMKALRKIINNQSGRDVSAYSQNLHLDEDQTNMVNAIKLEKEAARQDKEWERDKAEAKMKKGFEEFIDESASNEDMIQASNSSVQERFKARRQSEKGKSPDISYGALSAFGNFQKMVAKGAGLKSYGRELPSDEKYTKAKKLNSYAKNFNDNKTVKKFGKKSRMMSKIWTVLFFEVVAIFSFYVPSLLAMPWSFVYLAVAFGAFMPIYILLPGKHDFEGNDLGLVFLPAKALMKILIMIFILWQFSMINLLITLALAFFFYFLLPFSYREGQIYELSESIARFFFGIAIAFLFWFAFPGTPVGTSLMLMSIAFFATIPVKHESESGENSPGVMDMYRKVLRRSDEALEEADEAKKESDDAEKKSDEAKKEAEKDVM